MQKALSTSAVTLLVAVAGLGACVDANKRFDEFNNTLNPVVDASTTDRPMSNIANIGGDWYLAIFALGTNLHLFVHWDIDLAASPVKLNGTYQPLSAPPGVDPPPRLSVGAPLLANDVPVDDTASFAAAVVGTFDGMANPISGSKLGSQATINGTIKSMDLVCGTLTGTVCLGADAPCQGGVPVEPATFAAVRVVDITHLPALPPTDHCPDPGTVDAGIDAP